MSNNELRRIDPRDMGDLEAVIKERFGDETYKSLCQYAFDYACEEADILGLREIPEAFTNMCKLRRTYIFSSLITICEGANIAGLNVSVTYPLDKKEIMKRVRKMYGYGQRRDDK